MAKYLLIESRDPFESGDVGFCHELARRLAGEGNQVTVYLVQNGVLPARPGARAAGLAELLEAGVEVLADDFSLRERGISAGRLQAGIKPSSLDVVIDGMAEGCKVIWH
jgi:NAD(P)H-hydrate repair Nnr-like enzyme with NAD(P)H-hydrate epimerase domain